MIRVLFWWLIGVKNEQDAPIATAIRNASTEICIELARLIAMGAMTTAVAALFMISESVMVRINTRVSVRMGASVPAIPKSP